MTIEDKIKQIAEGDAFAQYPFIFDNIYRVDEMMEQTNMPCIVSLLPTDGNLVFRNGRWFDSENVRIGFFDLVPHDANGDDNAEIYNRMKALGFSLIEALRESGLFEAVYINRYTIECRQYSNIVTGVLFYVRIDDLGACVTIPEPPTPPTPPTPEPDDDNTTPDNPEPIDWSENDG